MDARRNETDHSPANAQRTVSGLFAGTALAQPVAVRTTLLIAAIVMVAFALYMVRPGEPSAVNAGNLSSEHGGSPASGHQLDSTVTPDATEAEPSSSASNRSSTTHTITVNGRSIPVPEDGNLHQTITEGDTTTTVNVSTHGDSSSSNFSVHSSTNSSAEGNTD